MHLSVVSWNCRYGLTKEKFSTLMQLDKEIFSNADIYVFQEVLENDFIDIPGFEIHDDYKYRHWYGDHLEFGDCHEANPLEGDLGIVLISKFRFHRMDQGLMRFRYVIPYLFYDGNNKEQFILIHVWTKSKPDGYFEPVYKALDYYKDKFPKVPIIMIGDYNFGVEYDSPFLDSFETKINQKIEGLKRAELIGDNKKTFYFPRNPNREYFNDYIFTKDCKAKFKVGNSDIWIPKDKEKISDHCPIVAEIEL